MIHEETHGLLACALLSFDDVIKFVTDSEVSASNATVVGIRVALKKGFSVSVDDRPWTSEAALKAKV